MAKGTVDYGHYVEQHLSPAEGVVFVNKGESLSRYFILDGSAPEISGIVAGEGAKVDLCYIIPPGVDTDLRITVDMDGEGATVNLYGLYLCSGTQKVGIATDVRHHSGGSTSLQVFNGIASGESHAEFSGKIVVAPDAQKTEAYQTNRNILLSEKALVDTTPTLEIYADDVKCSHGATVGSLNEDEQFYMRSRGVSEKEARILQLISFVAPVLAGISDEEQRQALSKKVEKAIREMVK